MFEDRFISIMTYPIELVLSEKFETLIARSVTNTRMRDFYDIHVLLHSERQQTNLSTFRKALYSTSEKRKSVELMKNAENVLFALNESSLMQVLWKNYQKKYPYAADYSWNDVIRSARQLAYEAGLIEPKDIKIEKPSVLETMQRLASDPTSPVCQSKEKENLER